MLKRGGIKVFFWLKFWLLEVQILGGFLFYIEARRDQSRFFGLRIRVLKVQTLDGFLFHIEARRDKSGSAGLD